MNYIEIYDNERPARRPRRVVAPRLPTPPSLYASYTYYDYTLHISGPCACSSAALHTKAGPTRTRWAVNGLRARRPRALHVHARRRQCEPKFY